MEERYKEGMGKVVIRPSWATNNWWFSYDILINGKVFTDIYESMFDSAKECDLLPGDYTFKIRSWLYVFLPIFSPEVNVEVREGEKITFGLSRKRNWIFWLAGTGIWVIFCVFVFIKPISFFKEFVDAYFLYLIFFVLFLSVATKNLPALMNRDEALVLKPVK